MWKQTIGFMIACTLFSSLAAADSAHDEEFYRSCLAGKVQQCEQKAQLVTSKGENTRRYGLAAVERLEFYRTHGDDLIRTMLNQKIPAKDPQVSYYLIKAYREHEQNGENRVAHRD